MPADDLEGARAALRDGRLADLLSVPECGWLDVKSGVYPLDDPAGAGELAKDVAGFANARTGGLILVGFSTRKEHDREILDQVRPVPRSLADLDRHRKLIRERVIPPPRGVSVDWIDCGSDSGVLVIDVPAQPIACLPYVVPGPARAAHAGSVSVAVPVREADATAWLPQAEIQRGRFLESWLGARLSWPSPFHARERGVRPQRLVHHREGVGGQRVLGQEHGQQHPVTRTQPAAAAQRRRDHQVGPGWHGDQPGRVAAGDDHARGRGERQPVTSLPAQHADDGAVSHPARRIDPGEPIVHVIRASRAPRRSGDRQPPGRARSAAPTHGRAGGRERG